MFKHRRESLTLPMAARVTRRTTLKGGGIGLVAAMGLTAPAVAAHQADLPDVIAAFVAGWEALDADQIADSYGEDAIHEDMPTGVVSQGREEIRGYLTAFLGAFSDATAEIPAAFATEDQAAVAWDFMANYTGMLPGFPQGEGQPIISRGCTLIEFTDDEITRTVDYYDVYGLLIQLGLAPAPDAATPAG